ncbi:MAG: L,D-transpeptidase [Myxococcales bacterium]|nr:L,D-transpeptidase [Myxococcales bacterium]
MSAPTKPRLLLALCGASLLASAGALAAAIDADALPHVFVSLRDATLRLSYLRHGRRVDRRFPVGLGRRGAARDRGTPVGRFRTGPNPRDRVFYDPHRRLPAFHRGHPFVRLDLAVGEHLGKPRHPYGIHGPVTPSLIWGPVSAGCLRMRVVDVREVFAFARRRPRLRVRLVRAADPRPTALVARGPRIASCRESALGIRRPSRLARARRASHGRVCGGVDHWWRVELQGGDHLRVELDHRGKLRVELYGIRAISSVAGGRFGLSHRVPRGPRNRGDRYLRIVAPRDRGTHGYALRVVGI